MIEPNDQDVIVLRSEEIFPEPAQQRELRELHIEKGGGDEKTIKFGERK
jgi:hypothetical protein